MYFPGTERSLRVIQQRPLGQLLWQNLRSCCHMLIVQGDLSFILPSPSAYSYLLSLASFTYFSLTIVFPSWASSCFCVVCVHTHAFMYLYVLSDSQMKGNFIFIILSLWFIAINMWLSQFYPFSEHNFILFVTECWQRGLVHFSDHPGLK